MTGPEHYKKAEELLAMADVMEDGLRQQRGVQFSPVSLREAAGVHATLALAAATAMSHWNSYELPMPQDDRLAWCAAASEKPGADKRRREAKAAELAELAQEG